jgi:hypothetical protein
MGILLECKIRYLDLDKNFMTIIVIGGIGFTGGNFSLEGTVKAAASSLSADDA